MSKRQVLEEIIKISTPYFATLCEWISVYRHARNSDATAKIHVHILPTTNSCFPMSWIEKKEKKKEHISHSFSNGKAINVGRNKNNGSWDVFRIETRQKKKRERTRRGESTSEGAFTTFFMMQYARRSMLAKTKPITFATVQWLNATIKKKEGESILQTKLNKVARW